MACSRVCELCRLKNERALTSHAKHLVDLLLASQWGGGTVNSWEKLATAADAQAGAFLYWMTIL